MGATIPMESLEIRKLGLKEKEKLFLRLCEFITERRQNLIEEVLAQRTRSLVLAVDDMAKEHNSGALLRTCDAFGLQDLYVVDQDFQKRSARNISKGSTKWVDCKHYGSWLGNDGCLEKLKGRGYRIVASSPEQNSKSISDFLPKGKTAILFGNEQLGLEEKVIQKADEVIHIPMKGFSESMNVSVSAGIIIHELIQKMKAENQIEPLEESDKLNLRIQWAQSSIPRGQEMANEISHQLFGFK